MYYKKILSIALILSMALFIFTGCGGSKDAKPGGDNNQGQTPDTQSGQGTELAAKGICPLTGLSMNGAEDMRPIAVMIDNEVNARPQSGLMKADIVYEMPAEGNITRYMAIFHHEEADKIGPVRSARPYFIDKAMEYGAVYVHCGGSPQALLDIRDLKLDTLNDLKGSPCFWRASDRKMPHNLYTSTKLMRKVTADKNMETKKAPQYFSFYDQFTDIGGSKVGAIAISYTKNYKVGYEYDENGKIYYRLVNGKRLADKDTNEEITTTNILMEIVGVKVLDEKGRLELTHIGTGKGYYFTAGKMMEITWEKSERFGRTIYKDLSGKEIKINKGHTWIQVIPSYVKIDTKE